MNSNPYSASIITASATFVAAVIAQIISHWLTRKRENHKYHKELYQKLYAPILFELYVYFDIRTAFRRSHDIKDGLEASVIKNNIIKHISDNLMYGTPQVISAFHKVRYLDYHEDFKGNRQSIAEIELFWKTLDQLARLNKKTKLFDSFNKNTLLKYNLYYLLWAIISELRGEDAYSILSYKHNLKIDKALFKVYKHLRTVFTKYNSMQKDIQFLRHSLEKVIIKLTNGSGEFSPHGKSFLEKSENL